MTLSDAYEIASAVLISVGGAAGILFVFSSWLGKVWAERILSKEKAKNAEDIEAFKKQLVLETESHKVRLKKSEHIFAREFDAASALVALVRDISPRHRQPTMDWSDACDDIAQDFGKIESQIGTYLRSHGAVLDQSVRDVLSSCMALAGESKFDVFEGEVSREANEAADQLYTKLQEAESALIVQVNSQITR